MTTPQQVKLPNGQTEGSVLPFSSAAVGCKKSTSTLRTQISDSQSVLQDDTKPFRSNNGTEIDAGVSNAVGTKAVLMLQLLIVCATRLNHF